MAYQGFEMEYFDGSQYITLYPYTTKEQSFGYDLGNFYGPVQITLLNNSWNSAHQQTVTVNGIDSQSQVFVTKILNTNDSISQQQTVDRAYGDLLTVQSQNNSLLFTTSRNPSVDINVQIYWKN